MPALPHEFRLQVARASRRARREYLSEIFAESATFAGYLSSARDAAEYQLLSLDKRRYGAY